MTGLPRSAACALLLLGCAGTSRAGPWTLNRDGYYLQIGASRSTSGSVFGFEGNDSTYAGAGGFRQATLQAYLEYGLDDPFSLVLSLPYMSARLTERSARRSESGAGDAQVGLKLRVLQEPLVVALQAEAKLPLGYDQPNGSLLGDGQKDLALTALAGKSFFQGGGFAQGQAGYRFRQGGPADEWAYGIGAGLFTGRRLLWMLDVSVVRGAGAGAIENHTRLGGSATVRISPAFEISAGMSRVIAGRNTPRATGISAALILKGARPGPGAGELGVEAGR